MPLEDRTIRSAKPGPAPIKLSDGRGLQLHIRTTGAKLWVLAYRFGGRQHSLRLGDYPKVTLAMARAAGAEARDKLANGLDPGAAPPPAAVAETSMTAPFEIWAARLLDAKERAGHTTNSRRKHDYVRRIVNAVAIEGARFGGLPLASIKPPTVKRLLETLVKQGKTETVFRARTFIGEVFRYVETEVKDVEVRDPTVALRGAVAVVMPKRNVKNHPAILRPARFGDLLRAMDGYPNPTIRAALQISALCYPRPRELREALWSHIDLDGALWIIPAMNAKMNREHHIPLSTQAVAIFRKLYDVTGPTSLVFPGTRSGRPLSDMTLGAALRALGFPADEQSAHGFRASASTMLNESGVWQSDVIETSLAHIIGSETRRAYARGGYWPQRVAMAQWWGDMLDGLRTRTH